MIGNARFSTKSHPSVLRLGWSSHAASALKVVPRTEMTCTLNSSGFTANIHRRSARVKTGLSRLRRNEEIELDILDRFFGKRHVKVRVMAMEVPPRFASASAHDDVSRQGRGALEHRRPRINDAVTDSLRPPVKTTDSLQTLTDRRGAQAFDIHKALAQYPQSRSQPKGASVPGILGRSNR